MNVASNYLQAYGDHGGLKEIYKIETIDVSTIRLLNPSSTKTYCLHPEPDALSFHLIEDRKETDAQVSDSMQLELNFKSSEGIRSLVLDEPIQVLNLTVLAEKSLSERGKRVLRDLWNLQSDNQFFQLGVGQGHIDEIKQKFADYLANRSLKPSKKLDVLSLIKVVGSYLDRKKFFLLLDSFGLDRSMNLSTAEQNELKQLSLDKRLTMRQQIIEEIRSRKELKEKILLVIQEMQDHVIKPWMARYQGLASVSELNERLMRILEPQLLAEQALHLLCEVFLEKSSIFENFLVQASPQLFCLDQQLAQSYQTVITRAQSYFYSFQTVYEFEELTVFLYKEFAWKWNEYSLNFIKRALQCCSFFSLYQNRDGILSIRHL